MGQPDSVNQPSMNGTENGQQDGNDAWRTPWQRKRPDSGSGARLPTRSASGSNLAGLYKGPVRKGGTLDRGTGYYKEERAKQKLAALIETGKHAGATRVEYVGVSRRQLLYHLLKRDFFITAINASAWHIAVIITLLYIATMVVFAVVWWGVVLGYGDGQCLTPVDGFGDALIFSTITQTTIGYGNIAILPCWTGAWLLVLQSLLGMIMDAIVIGIVFARISNPKQRGRTIFISDSACIARRDSVLKLMFRVADARRAQVIEPRVLAYLYTWGDGRYTAEGEYLPCRCEPLIIGYVDGMMLVPVIIEHTIDERSPLFGHTHDSLMAVQAEIVVTFEGTTEFGNPFSVRQSYLPTELHWGHQFVKITGFEDNSTHYIVDIARFHDVEPQRKLPMMPPSKLSAWVVGRQIPTVPYPLLAENTLCVSDFACVCRVDGQLTLMWRVGDTYPYQMVEVHARAYIYRWTQDTKGHSDGPRYTSYTQHELELGFSEIGQDRLLLRLPQVIRHVITDKSPLANWLTDSSRLQDADSDIVFLVEGYWYCNRNNAVRMRTYNVLNSVKFNHKFVNIITPPQNTRDFNARVDWSRFHEVEEVRDAYKRPPPTGMDSVKLLQRLSTKRQAYQFFEQNSFGNTVDPPESYTASESGTLHANQQLSWMSAPSRPMHVSGLNHAAGMSVPGALGSYMGEVLQTDPGLLRYISSTRRLTEDASAPEASTLALVSRSPEQHVPYNRLTSLFEAGEALEKERTSFDTATPAPLAAPQPHTPFNSDIMQSFLAQHDGSDAAPLPSDDDAAHEALDTQTRDSAEVCPPSEVSSSAPLLRQRQEDVTGARAVPLQGVQVRQSEEEGTGVGARIHRSD